MYAGGLVITFKTGTPDNAFQNTKAFFCAIIQLMNRKVVMIWLYLLHV